MVKASYRTHARRSFDEKLLTKGGPITSPAIERMRPAFASEVKITESNQRHASPLAKSVPRQCPWTLMLGCWKRRCYGSPASRTWRRPSARPWRSWERSRRCFATVAPAGTTTSPCGASDPWRSAEISPCASGLLKAAGGPRSSASSSARGNETPVTDTAYIRILRDRTAQHPINPIEDLATGQLRPSTTSTLSRSNAGAVGGRLPRRGGAGGRNAAS